MTEYEKADEGELALLVAEGDRLAFPDLFDRFSARVFGLVIMILANPMPTEDLT